MLRKHVQEVKGTRKLTGGLSQEFLEQRLEQFPCQRQRSLADEDFEVHSPLYLLIFNFHNWP